MDRFGKPGYRADKEGVSLESVDVDIVFRQAYAKYYSAVLRYIKVRLYYGEGRAEECAQDVFLLLYRSLPSMQDEEHIRAWLYRTADNLLGRYHRRYQVENKHVAFYEDYAQKEDDARLAYCPDLDLLADQAIPVDEYKQRILEQLSDAERQAYTLYYEQKLPGREVAERLGVSENALWVRLNRLRAHIKQLIQELSL